MAEFELSPFISAGDGSESNPFVSDDGSAGIAGALRALSERGGVLRLPSGRYDINKPLVIDTPSTCVDGGVWACNTDPNGVFESRFGTKIRLNGQGYPAMKIGENTDPISGTIIKNIGFQSDIVGMDTRALIDFENPEKNAGLCLDSVRTDQCAFSKLSFCGFAAAVTASGNSEIDACIFEGINMDGCAVGVYFAPRASYYAHVRSCVIADTPYYGVYATGKRGSMHNLEIRNTHFVRNGGGFTDTDGRIPAAILFDGASRCAVTECLFDDAGTFWYYENSATKNEERKPSRRKTVGLYIIGNSNRVRDCTFLNSSDDSIRIEGNGNVLMNIIADGNIRISGKGNAVSGIVFTKPSSKLILEGEAKESTEIIGVSPDRIVKS